MFNDRGTGAVSTNHIAAAMGISPGNLYYYFDSKQDIIRALFAMLFEEWGNTYRLPSGRAPVLADLDALISGNFRLIWDYRFAYRELAVLLRDSTELAETYRELRRSGYDGFKSLIEAFAEAGVLERPASARELESLTELCWIISEQWPVDLELRGRTFDAAGIRDGISLMHHIFRPYIRPVRSGPASSATEGTHT